MSSRSSSWIILAISGIFSDKSFRYSSMNSFKEFPRIFWDSSGYPFRQFLEVTTKFLQVFLLGLLRKFLLGFLLELFLVILWNLSWCFYCEILPQTFRILPGVASRYFYKIFTASFQQFLLKFLQQFFLGFLQNLTNLLVSCRNSLRDFLFFFRNCSMNFREFSRSILFRDSSRHSFWSSGEITKQVLDETSKEFF